MSDTINPYSLAFVAGHADEEIVSLKSDGVRTRDEGVYFVNQLFEVCPDARPEIESVFDGELMSGLRGNKFCLLLFDTVLIQKESFFDRGYAERLCACEKFEWQ